MKRIKGLLGIIDIVVLFIVIMALLLTGKVTATEAGAASAFLAFVLCLIRRKLSWAKSASRSNGSNPPGIQGGTGNPPQASPLGQADGSAGSRCAEMVCVVRPETIRDPKTRQVVKVSGEG